VTDPIAEAARSAAGILAPDLAPSLPPQVIALLPHRAVGVVLDSSASLKAPVACQLPFHMAPARTGTITCVVPDLMILSCRSARLRSSQISIAKRPRRGSSTKVSWPSAMYSCHVADLVRRQHWLANTWVRPPGSSPRRPDRLTGVPGCQDRPEPDKRRRNCSTGWWPVRAPLAIVAGGFVLVCLGST
jgi:hypothetical protein